MAQYLTPMGPSKLHVMPLFEIGPLEPRFSEWLVFEGISVDETGRQHFLDASVAYKRAVLNCIEYLAKFGYTKAQVGLALKLIEVGRVSLSVPQKDRHRRDWERFEREGAVLNRIQYLVKLRLHQNDLPMSTNVNNVETIHDLMGVLRGKCKVATGMGFGRQCGFLAGAVECMSSQAWLQAGQTEGALETAGW
jgi:hypothetical protein